MKTVLIIPDGAGIRNFLCTRFLERLLAHGEVTVWHALADTILRPHQERWGNAVTWQPLPAYRESLAEHIFRQAKLYAQMYWWYVEDNSDSVMRINFRYPSKAWKHRQLTRICRLLGRANASKAGAQRLDRLHARAVCRRTTMLTPYREFLHAQQPDVVFNAHQRASCAVPAMLAARDLGIPTATFIYSWDNLPKGRMAVHADHYLVWSDYMKAEMAKYYPEVAPSRVHVTGTPQFEPCFDASLHMTREAFFAEHGLDPARPVICYSGDDHMASPYDPQYLADLAAALRAWPENTIQSAAIRAPNAAADTTAAAQCGGDCSEPSPSLSRSEPRFVPGSAGGCVLPSEPQTQRLTPRQPRSAGGDCSCPAPSLPAAAAFVPGSDAPVQDSGFRVQSSSSPNLQSFNPSILQSSNLPRPQILFRRCPTDTSGRHDAVLRAFPEIKVSAPRWLSAGGDWTQVVPTPDDVRLLVNVVRHCDAVINVGSTMAMDFAIMDKPALYIAYDPKSGTPGEAWNQQDFYRHPHFGPLLDLDPVWWVRSPQEFVPRIAEALSHGADKTTARKAWYGTHACQPLGAASARLVAALQDIVRRPNPVRTPNAVRG